MWALPYIIVFALVDLGVLLFVKISKKIKIILSVLLLIGTILAFTVGFLLLLEIVFMTEIILMYIPDDFFK